MSLSAKATLEQGGYGYFGSTTIAYGPADDNGAADLICQYFLQDVLRGASVGRAALVARQQFVEHTAQMDPVDLKTLAQFYLLGDPSVDPVTEHSGTMIPKSMATPDANRFFRAERREKMKETGDFLSKTKPTASQQIPTGKMSPKAKVVLSNIAKKVGLGEEPTYMAFTVKGAQTPNKTKSRAIKSLDAPSRYLIAMGKQEESTPDTTGETEKIKRGIAVVAKELNGRIVGYRIYLQR